jgi:hypothetical protein
MRFPCPSCDARLRLPDTVAGARRVTCPHCSCAFRLPEEVGEARSTAVDRPSSSRRAEDLDERRSPLRPRKRFKAKKSTNRMPIIITAVAGVMVLVGSVCLAVVYVRSRPKDDVVAAAPTGTTRQETPIQNAPNRTNPDNALALARPAGEPARPLIGQQPKAEPPQEAPSPQLPMPIEPAKPVPPPAATPVPPPPPVDPVVGLEVGNLAPEIKGEDTDRKAFKLSDYKGKVVLLDFWGYW